MSNRLFLYVGAKLLGLGDGAGTTGPEWYFGGGGRDWHEGFDQGCELFECELKPASENWFYLVEYTPRSKMIEVGNMRFRLFAPWKSGSKELRWMPPENDEWEAPHHLGMPFKVGGDAKYWEFISSSIAIKAKKESITKAFDIPRTGRANFSTSKTGEKVVGLNNLPDCSGRVQKGEFDEFIHALEALVPRPLMSVSDCNTFHTTGYLWGKFALDKSWADDSSGAVLVIDIDQHSDAGSDTSGIVSSDGWGHPLIKNYPKAAYVVLGLATSHNDNVSVHVGLRKANAHVTPVNCKKTVPTGFLAPKGDNIASTITPTLLRGAISGIAAALETLWGNLEGLLVSTFKHVFITVDRDSMFGNRTHWQDRDVTFETPAEIIKVIDAILFTLARRGVILSGFDITGLPECDESATLLSKLLNKTDTRARSKVIKDLKTEIQSYADKYDQWSIAERYVIKVAGSSEDDSLQLNYSLKNTDLGLETDVLEFGADGKGLLAASKLSDWQIRFPSHGNSWSTLSTSSTAMLTGGRYTYTVTKVV